MHPPRRLCSLLGGVFLIFFCFFYVADHYNYRYYVRTPVVTQDYEGQSASASQQPGDGALRIIALGHGLRNDTDGGSDSSLPHRWGAVQDRRSARDKRKRQCRKKYSKCSRLSTDPEPPLDVFQAEENATSVAEVMEGAPLWSQFADRGYIVLGTNGSAIRRLPDVLIIGAKKSGTRALLAFLRVHPSIRASGPEIHYFDRFYSRGLSWYRSQLPFSLEGQLTVEKTPAYFTTPGVPARVRADLPGARLLLVVRNPVTRALSDYTQSLSKHRSRRAFEELVFVKSTAGLVNSEWGPISGGLYAKHLKRWLAHFPRSSIHVVSGENLILDPATELCKVQEFLGLRRVITDKHFFFNATKGFPCLVKREKTGRPHCLGSSKGRSHPPVSQTTYNTLRDFYRPFNFKFYKMIGQNLHW